MRPGAGVRAWWVARAAQYCNMNYTYVTNVYIYIYIYVCFYCVVRSVVYIYITVILSDSLVALGFENEKKMCIENYTCLIIDECIDTDPKHYYFIPCEWCMSKNASRCRSYLYFSCVIRTNKTVIYKEKINYDIIIHTTKTFGSRSTSLVKWTTLLGLHYHASTFSIVAIHWYCSVYIKGQ